jgi:multidrug efflux pump subunit AcrB
MTASRALNEVRTAALSKAPSSADPGVSQIMIEVGGEDQLSKASFITQRQPLKDRADSVSVRMNYETKADSGDSYTATFTGGIEEFDKVTNQPEPFGDTERTDIKFRIELPEPEELTNAEDDVLAELNAALGQTNIDLKIEARGPVRVREEVEQ